MHSSRYASRRVCSSGRTPAATPGSSRLANECSKDTVKDQPSRAAAYCGTSAASSLRRSRRGRRGSAPHRGSCRPATRPRPAATGRELPRLERRVVGFGDRTERRERAPREPGTRCRGPRPARREARAGRRVATAPGAPRAGISTQAPGGVETPAVIGALEHTRLAVPERQGRPAMGAAVGEGHDPPVGPVEHPGLAQEHDPPGLLVHLGRSGHRMPASRSAGIDVGEQADHGDPPWCAAARRRQERRAEPVSGSRGWPARTSPPTAPPPARPSG